MDLSLLKSLNYKASLVDYLGGGKAGHFQDIANNLFGAASKAKVAAVESDAGASINITLSEEAQALLQNGTGDGNTAQTGVQKAAQNFLVGFFDQSGLDLENLSDEALGLIQGLQDVISSSAATGRDMATDTAEEKYAGGNRKVYTLTGNGTRLRLAVEYQDGKPQKLSITDITGGQVETAEITLQNGDQKTGTLSIERTQRQYVNGHMASLADLDPIEVGLYA